ncbi:YxeA family protein [Caniella muris]|uniref:YxeA family protein n=1 Tax=Caniella muris TaxID=2941502 RepID=UPI00203C182F|nr:YxeA family protein [Caniella muris]
MARKVVVGLVAALGVCAIAAVVLYGEYSDPGRVYVQVDDNRVRSIEPHGGMVYSYSLDGATPDGKPAPVTLDTERILRDKAYLLLETRPLVGVVSWEEVAWDQIPEAARAALPAPEAAGA